MAADSVEGVLSWLRELALVAPSAEAIGEQVEQLAAQVARTTGASVRVWRGRDLQVRFAGRNAAAAASQFRQLAASEASGWGQQLAAGVVGRLV